MDNNILVEIKIESESLQARISRIEHPAPELQKYLVNSDMLKHFLFVAFNTHTASFPDFWKTGEWVKIERFLMI